MPAPNVPPVIFLHGIGGSARVWAPQMASFAAAGYAPVALDLPGYGARPPVDQMNFEDLAADVEATIDRRGAQRPILLGHSMGGMIVQTMLRRRPQFYRAAIICCSSPAFGNPAGDFQKKFVAERLEPLQAGKTMRDIAAGMVDGMTGPAPDPAGRALAIESMAATPDSTYRAAVHCLVRFDERGNLANIRIPVLCLACEHDRNAPPAMMERMAARIPGARYVCLAGIGHLPSAEAPALFDRTVIDFLRVALAGGKSD